MKAEEYKQAIRHYAMEELNIQKIGFTDASPFLEYEEGLRKKQREGLLSGFEHPIIEERIYPDRIFDQPKTILSLALAYPTKPKEKLERKKGERRGAFARVSWGVDYHTLMAKKLALLEDYIKELIPGVRCKSMVDTGELIDVAVAQRAGLGFIGYNGLLVTKEYGSYVYLGDMILSVALPPDKAMANQCGECRRCVQFCPTGALLGNGSMNPHRCLSFQTQNKQFMGKEFRRKMSHVIYGCDICQQVCPYNRGMDFHLHPEMEDDPQTIFPELTELLTLSNREFKEKFGHLSGAWRGKKPLQRNAIIALANYKDKTAVPSLLELMEKDARPVIVGTSAWAVAEIIATSSVELERFFKEVQERFPEDEDFQTEMNQALHRLREKETDRSS
ncbi:tRNA epoxyqueuosine(34) reductase QueG [Atopobacter sp. AH10]|uniref:tRNA epoxyqueuosine(34) reductase QueG n=1 Tax=Atopobacter sp. AH10 TaxID=2315861 RepID=UPI000EF19906|nr:tRNA epoxyqueuosine(34) reductase QueG [Atopobacter sp. AH10]RLK63692.1 tRNA epoxyqueuosine(34) reductase QueG [Atopobacter sp. AH10]